MALDALFALGDEDAVFVIGLDAAGTRRVSALRDRPRGRARSRSPRCHGCADDPNGFNEWLICQAIAWAARARLRARLAQLLARSRRCSRPKRSSTARQQLARRALLRRRATSSSTTCSLFNRKFFPCWERRFLVYERRLDLPRVGLAALAAEAYLPFQASSDEPLGLGLGAGAASAGALNWGFVAQHGARVRAARRCTCAARSLAAVCLPADAGCAASRRPRRAGRSTSAPSLSLRSRWSRRSRPAGLDFWHSSSTSAVARRLRAPEWGATAVAVAGLVLLGLSLATERPAASPPSPLTTVEWLGGFALAGRSRRALGEASVWVWLPACSMPTPTSRPRRSPTAASCSSPCVCSCKWNRLPLPPARLPTGRRDDDRRPSTLLTNTLPIAAGVLLFNERVPGGCARRSPPCRVLPRHRRCGAPCSSGSLTGFAASARARPSQSSA